MCREPLTNAAGWIRPGGHAIQFFSTDEELQEILDLGLPEEYAPWHMTGADSVPRTDDPKRYQDQPWACQDVNLASCGYSAIGNPRTTLFIWSERLTCGLPPQEIGAFRYEGLCSFNGFIHLLPGTSRLGPRHFSGMSIVDRIVSTPSGEERRYPEYLRVFNRLRRMIRKRLVAPSVRVSRSGREYVDDINRWTEAAVSAWAAGAKYECRPLLPDEVR